MKYKTSYAFNIQKVTLMWLNTDLLSGFLYYKDLILEDKFLKRESSLPVPVSMK